MVKNILITGSCGQLGTEMRRLSVLHPQFDYFFTNHHELDITQEHETDRFLEAHNIDCVVNCAAYTAVDKAEENPVPAKEINTLGVGRLAAAIGRRKGVFIHISTDYVYDGKQSTPYKEEDAVNPLSVYGKTKEEGDRLACAGCENTVILRTSWVYSVTGNNFVKTMLRLGRERKELGVVFDQVGTPTSARDLAGAVYTILEKGVRPGIYNYSNEGVVSWYDFAKAIHRIAGITGCRVKPILTAEYPVKAERPSYTVLDKTKIKNTYALDIPYWEDSLEECINELENKEA